MKILHVVDKMDPERGGVSQAVRTMISGLSLYGIENQIVSLDSPGEPFLVDISCPLHALGPAEKYWAYSRKLIPWLKDKLFLFDVVIIHGLWQFPTYAVHRAKELLSKKNKLTTNPCKILIMPHGMLDPYFQKAPGRKLKAIRNRIYWSLIENRAIKESDGLLFTCETERILSKLPFKPYKPRKEMVIGLGVEKPPSYTAGMRMAFANVCNKIKNENFLLFLSRIHEKKGIDLLLEGYRRIQKSNGNQVLPKLIIAGPGLDSHYGKKIQKQINEDTFLDKNVFLTGMLTGEAKWGAFYGCDAFLLPSHQENFGIAIVEALACKKPVMISNKVNIWREISDAQAGIIENDTTEGVCNLLNAWLSFSRTKRERMAENAFSCYKQNFSVKAASEKLLRNLASEEFYATGLL